MKIKYIIGAVALLATGFFAPQESTAQSRPVQLLETHVDARSAAMGGFTLANTDRNYLYVNPASIFQTDKALTISAGGMMFPKMEMVKGQLMNATATAGWKFLDRHVAYAGFRYQGGLSIPSVNDQFGTPGKDLSPFDWSVDLGYAFKFNNQLSAFASGSFVQSFTGRTAYAAAFNLGANYLLDLSNNGSASLLNIAARVADLGAPVAFSAKESFALPSRVEVTGDYSREFSKNRRLAAVLGGRYYFLADKVAYSANVGAEYTLYNMVSLRAGYQYGSNSSSFLSTGVGVNLYNVKLDLALLSGMGEFKSNRMMLSLSFDY
ncbi:MAG: PorV/PorQ family protein [Porphyromonas sp.]|nr:PorV/PorQ family protein [Porphyromonas sp.]